MCTRGADRAGSAGTVRLPWATWTLLAAPVTGELASESRWMGSGQGQLRRLHDSWDPGGRARWVQAAADA